MDGCAKVRLMLCVTDNSLCISIDNELKSSTYKRRGYGLIYIVTYRQWMYLEPIFTSADITKQLPVESKKYNSMERTWRRIMRNAHDTPNVSKVNHVLFS